MYCVVVETLLGYLRFAIQNNEISQRVYDLTERIILMNPSFVSAWFDSVEQSSVGWFERSVCLS